MKPGRVVVVVGDVVNDVVVRPLAPVAVDSDTPSEISRSPGGQGANQAAWMGSLGLGVRLAARVGAADIEAHRSALEWFGVDARLTADPDSETGSIVVISDPGRGRSMFTDRGASARLCDDDLPPSLLEGAGWLHVSGYSLFGEASRSSVLRLRAEAAAAGIPVSVDPSSVACLSAAGRGRFLDWTGGFTVAFPNRDEGVLLAGSGDPEDVDGAAERLLEWYAVVALKLGVDGVLVRSRDEGPYRIPAVGARVVDTTGAGDAFCAGFLAGWLEGLGLRPSAVAGVEAAALCVATAGARPRALR